MVMEQTTQMPFADAQAAGEPIDIGLVQRPEFYQTERARYRIRRAAPSAEIGRGLWAAAKTRAKAGLLRRCRGGKKDDVLRQRRARRADRSAIDAGGFDSGEKPPVEAGVALADRAITGVVIEIHADTVIPRPVRV